MALNDLSEQWGPEQAKVLMPWMFVWVVSFGLELILATGLLIWYLLGGSVDMRVVIAVILAGQAFRSLVFAVCTLKTNQLAGQTPNWRKFIHPLVMGVLALSAISSLFVTF